MKKLFLFLLGFTLTGFVASAQTEPNSPHQPLSSFDIPTADDFVTPTNTGANQTVGLNNFLNDYAGGQIGAFYDLDGDGSLECVGLESIITGFFGLPIWGDDSSTDEKDGLSAGDIPYFFILDIDGVVWEIVETPPFPGYVTNGTHIVQSGTPALASELYTEALGCIDQDAFNYNPAATAGYGPDGDASCVAKLLGCTDEGADNYDPSANTDDGNCFTTVNGCTFDWADNYDPSANTDDGSCTLAACMNPDSDNYNENATSDDGSCFRMGCMNPDSDNYDALATDDDGSCYRMGCTSDWAENYDGLATDDDGSCYLNGCTFDWADNYDSNATIDDGSCTLLACMNPDSDNYNENATSDDGSCYRFGCMNSDSDNFDGLATDDDGSCYREGCMDDRYDNYDSLATQDSNDVCVKEGCYNPIANNYDELANQGDQEALCEVSQIDPSVVTVTSNNMSVLFPASNVSLFDESTNLEAGDIVFAVYETGLLEAPAVGYSAPNAIASAGSVEWTGETVGVAVFGADGLEDNGYYEAEDLVWLVVHDGVVYNADVTYNDENTSYSVGQYSEGGYISVYSIDRTTPFYEGCMDPTYINFNPLATTDDDSCSGLISFGCTDPSYVNYAGSDVDVNNIDVNANNYGNPFGENLLYNVMSGLTDLPSNVAADFHAADICQTELEGCTDPMALNYNPLATVNKETICNWTFTPNGNEPNLAAYDVDSDGNITNVNYSFGGVDPENVNDGFVGSDFYLAQEFTAEGPNQVFSPTDHVVDALAQVFEWIEDDKEADDALLAQTIADADALLAYTLDSAATAFAADEAADEALLDYTLDSAATAHEEYSHMRDNEFDDMFMYLSDSISMTLDSAATAFAADEADDAALLAQTIADYEALLAYTLDSAATAFAADEEADAALLAYTLDSAATAFAADEAADEALLAYTLDSAAVAFAADEAADEELQQLTLDSLNYHREPIVIDLKEGWNTIGYYLRHSSYVIDQFESQYPIEEGAGGAAANINIVKDNVGNFWWPDFQFDGLGELTPGQGYQVRVKDGGAKNDFMFDHNINREDSEYRNLDPTVPQWAIDMPVDVHPNDIRTLIRVVNMLGQEVNPQDQFKGEVLLYLYNDGTVEKKIVH